MRDFEFEPDEHEELWLGEEDDEGSEVVACPACGCDVYEDAQQCPTCGQYIVHSTNPWTEKPWWWVALGLAGIMAVLWLMMP